MLGAGADSELTVAAGRDYLQRMEPGGWATPGWPVEYGGAGLDPADEALFNELLDDYERPDLYPFLIGLSTAGPMICRHGTDAQRARLLAPTRSGREIWCQLFSEPDAGSDLASLRTRARPSRGGWAVDGHKFWVSRASYADWGLLLARTDPDLPARRGITAFVLPMDSSGVTISPIRQMNGDRNFYEVFLDNVHIDDSLRLGPVHAGWSIALETLSAERSAAGALGMVGLGPDSVVELIRDHPAANDPFVRALAAEAYTRLLLLRVSHRGRPVEGSKILFAAAVRSYIALARRLRGLSAQLHDDAWTPLELTAPSLSIRGGTDEIQRNLIAERVLGLPREPRPQ